MKLHFIFNIIAALLVAVLLHQAVSAQHLDSRVYELDLSELMEINVVKDSAALLLAPSYNIAIEDLMQLQIVKELDICEQLSVSYDMPIEDLMQVKLPIYKSNSSVEPTYEMSLEGVLEMEIHENYTVKEKMKLSYDISLSGLMQIDIHELSE